VEAKVIEQQEKIAFMEMQKKNEDLCSKIENDLPIDNELGGLEQMNDGQNIMGNFENDSIEPEQQLLVPGAENYDQNRSNSLLMMEAEDAGAFHD
jgi:hypothetical protein